MKTTKLIFAILVCYGMCLAPVEAKRGIKGPWSPFHQLMGMHLKGNDTVNEEKVDTDGFYNFETEVAGASESPSDYTPENITVRVFKPQQLVKIQLNKTLYDLDSIVFEHDRLKAPPGEKVVETPKVKLSQEGLSNGYNKITQVIDGKDYYDAVNVGQLNRAIQNSESRMRKFSNANAASALATANIPQVYAPGKNAVGVGLGNMNGQSAVAVGISTINENGDWIFKGTATVNSKGQGFGGGASYVW